MAIVYLSIGTNLGDRKSNINKAVSLFEAMEIRLVRLSSFYETEPWGVTLQPQFLNAAAHIETALSPAELLCVLKEIERRMGRLFESTRWGPRIIDLDILFYDDREINNACLKIPHPHIADRAFVLDPMAEIAPEFIHPVLGKSIMQLKTELKDNPINDADH